MDIYEVDLLYGDNVKRDNGYKTAATKFNSFQVEVQRGRFDREVDQVIEER